MLHKNGLRSSVFYIVSIPSLLYHKGTKDGTEQREDLTEHGISDHPTD